jgi:hypothetical protein
MLFTHLRGCHVLESLHAHTKQVCVARSSCNIANKRPGGPRRRICSKPSWKPPSLGKPPSPYRWAGRRGSSDLQPTHTTTASLISGSSAFAAWKARGTPCIPQMGDFCGCLAVTSGQLDASSAYSPKCLEGVFCEVGHPATGRPVHPYAWSSSTRLPPSSTPCIPSPANASPPPKGYATRYLCPPQQTPHHPPATPRSS